MNKRGNETFFFVSLILVVLTLVVIISFFASFNYKEDIDKAACKQSAVVKGTIPLDQAKEVVSLQCKTTRICVTDKAIGDGNCEQELGNKFVTKRVSGTEENKKNQIKMILAREMAGCWEMLGEGNLQIFKQEATLNDNGHIVVCSRVMFDNTITSKFKEVDGMSAYLLTHKVKGKDVSYWDYFRNTPDGDTLQMISGDPVMQNSFDTDVDKIDLTKQKAIFYLETSKSDLIKTVVGGAAGAGFFLGTAYLTGGKGLAFLSGAAFAVGGAAGELAEKLDNWLRDNKFGEEQKYVGGVFLTDYTQEGFSTLQGNQDLKFESIP